MAGAIHDQPIRVAIIDDHELARGGLRAMLLTSGFIDVVAAEPSCEAGVAAVREHAPDVVLLDVRMPDVGGLRCLDLLGEVEPAPKIIIVSGHDDPALVFEAIRKGAAGFVRKAVGSAELVAAVERAVAGQLAVDADLLRTAFVSPGAAITARDQELTTREREILTLLAEGMTNKEIGANLSISEDTVKKHVQSLISKLGAVDRTQAAIIAHRRGILEPPTPDVGG